MAKSMLGVHHLSRQKAAPFLHRKASMRLCDQSVLVVVLPFYTACGLAPPNNTCFAFAGSTRSPPPKMLFTIGATASEETTAPPIFATWAVAHSSGRNRIM